MAEGSSIEERAAFGGRVGFDGADEGRHGAGGGGDLSEGGVGIFAEAFFEEQVAGRVAGDDEFGEHHELGASDDEGVVGFEDEMAVTGEIADSGIELSETDAHGGKWWEPSSQPEREFPG